MKRITFLLVIAMNPFTAFATEAAAVESPSPASFYESQFTPGLERLTSRDTLNLLGVGVIAIAAARTQDEEMRDAWRGNQRMNADVASLGDKFGVYAISAVIAGGQYLFDRDNSYHHMRSLVAVTVIGGAMKFTFNRERPNQLDRFSLPSGHTYSAFATASSLQHTYGWTVGAIAYPIAAIVGLSRITDDYHWLSDVTAGAVLGTLIGHITYYPVVTKSELARSLMIVPVLEDGGGQLQVSIEIP